MHQGCFVWMPTPPLSDRRTPRPGPVRVCVCVPCLAGSGGPASRARCGALHLFLWGPLLRSLLGPLRDGVALFSFWVPRLFLAFIVFGPGLCCGAPSSLVFFALLVALVVCFP